MIFSRALLRRHSVLESELVVDGAGAFADGLRRRGIGVAEQQADHAEIRELAATGHPPESA